MKFLLDQSVERRLASILRNLSHDVKVVSIDYPAGILDQEVLLLAYKESRILLTNDKGDFGELIFRHHHSHSGVILFRVRDNTCFPLSFENCLCFFYSCW